jgi:tRNA(Ile)-lysidine synthase
VRAAEPDGPLADDELSAILAPLREARLVALAVSGGADSLALLDAVDRWRRSGGAMPGVVVLTVDHRLRRGSGREAGGVAAVARARGMEARVLAWRGPRPSANIEAAARQARYRLLLEACAESGASHLVLAHHRDDQAETFLMRLQRGAGVFGLAAMRPAIACGPVTIVRPFLEIARTRLVATTAAAGLTPAQDPMNTDPRFARGRIRRIMPLLAAEGFDPAMLTAAARRLADAASAIDAAVDALIGIGVTVDAYAVVNLDPASFASAADEVRMRLLARMILAVGGEDYVPRHDSLLKMAAAMIDPGRPRRFKRTLGGAVVEWYGGRFVVYREMGRDGLPALALRAGFNGRWDRRFAVSAGERTPRGLTLAALGDDAKAAAGSGHPVPADALAVVPAIRRRGKVLSVPLLAVPGPDIIVRPLIAERLLRPPLFPDFTA